MHGPALPKPYFQNDSITIYNADCQAILPALARSSVDLVLTDPPYGISYRSRRKNTSQLPTTVRNDENLNCLRAAMPLIDAALKPNRHAYVFAAPMRIGEAADIVAGYWKLKNLLVWDKGNAGSRGDLQAGYAANWEAILYGSKGRRPLSGPRPRCVYRYDWQAWHDPVHPTVKPVAMMRWLIAKSTEPGEMILDPFMGSGVVLRAAADLGRKAIGIEIEPGYCKVAVSRVS